MKESNDSPDDLLLIIDNDNEGIIKVTTTTLTLSKAVSVLWSSYVNTPYPSVSNLRDIYLSL